MSEHPSFPAGRVVRVRMSGQLGTITLSRTDCVYVDIGIHVPLIFDGWSAKNNLRLVKES